MKYLILLVSLLAFAGCGSDPQQSGGGGFSEPLPPVGQPLPDDSVIRGRAEVQVDSSHSTAFHKFIQSLMPYAYAATGVTTVTYTNAASVSFTINVAAFGAAGFTGTTLDLGSVSLATIDDNHLKVCNPGGNTKCTNAYIRVYTTGSVAGFVHQVDLYGAPVYAGSLNPNSPIGLNAAGSVNVQAVAIAGNKNRLRMADFPTPTYSVNSDFSNAGSGDYSMNFVVEYVLAP